METAFATFSIGGTKHMFPLHVTEWNLAMAVSGSPL